ncbi:MAG: ABC transporter transmembrane domain-containing protein [Nitrosomonadales bacterium]
MKNIWRSIQFLPEYRARILSVIFVGTVLGAIGAGTPYIYKKIVDVISGMLAGRIPQADAVHLVVILLGAFFILRFSVVVFTAWQAKQADDVFLDTMNTFRQRVFDNMTRKSIDYFEKTRVGEIMDRFGAIHTITQWLFSLTEGTLANVLQMLFIIGVLLYKVPIVGIVVTGVVIFNLVVSYGQFVGPSLIGGDGKYWSGV